MEDDLRVSVRGGSSEGILQEDSGLLAVARGTALGKEDSPLKIGPGCEELRVRPGIECVGTHEEGVSLIEPAQDGSKTAQIVADRTLCGQTMGRHLI